MKQPGNLMKMWCLMIQFLCFPWCSFVWKALRDGLAKGHIAGCLTGELVMKAIVQHREKFTLNLKMEILEEKIWFHESWVFGSLKRNFKSCSIASSLELRNFFEMQEPLLSVGNSCWHNQQKLQTQCHVLVFETRHWFSHLRQQAILSSWSMVGIVWWPQIQGYPVASGVAFDFFVWINGFQVDGKGLPWVEIALSNGVWRPTHWRVLVWNHVDTYFFETYVYVLSLEWTVE